MKNHNSGEIFNIQKFCVNDGPGIRTTVFFKGCPLRCEWCHNPESQAKEHNLHTAIETCGFADSDKIKQIAEYTDLFLFDFKESNPKLHKTYTGVDNILIQKNLSLLNELKKDIILRCPVIPGYNDRKENYDKICELANTLTSIIGIEIEPYHAFGENKYLALGKQPLEISMQTDEQINEIIDYIRAKTNILVKKA